MALLLLLLLPATRTALLRAAGHFLVVESPLQPAAAIVVLSGNVPFRELEAIDLYRAGWAPRIVTAREIVTDRERALRAEGLPAPSNADLARQLFAQRGVPDSALITPDGTVASTAEELRLAFAALRPLAPAGTLVILVTSPYHTRRVALTWQRTARGHFPGVVRPSHYDPFDPDAWWLKRDSIISLAREYLSLANDAIGAPARERQQ